MARLHVDKMVELRKKAAKGIVYTSILTAAGKLVAIGQLALLARFLCPSDFGIIALAFVVLTAATTFTSVGIERILVQKPTLEKGFIGTAWSVNLVRGALVSLVCFILAPFYAKWSGSTGVEQVLYILALGPIFTSLSTPAVTIAERNLDFKTICTFELTIDILRFTILVTLAFYLRDVLALALGHVILCLLKSIISWLWFGILELPGFHRRHFADLLSVGRHFFVIAAGAFIMTQADNFIIGKVLGATILGYYTLSYRISQLVVDLTNRIIGRIAFPLFSQIQAEKDLTKKAFGQIFHIQIAILIPLVALIVILAPEIIKSLLGTDYVQSIPILQALAFLTLGRGLSHILVPFIIGTGYVNFASKIKAFETCIFLLGVLLGALYFDVIGATIGAGLGYFSAGLFRLIFVSIKLELNFSYFMSKISPPFLATGIATVFVLLQNCLIDRSPFLLFILGSISFSLLYCISSLFIQKDMIRILKASYFSIHSSAYNK